MGVGGRYRWGGYSQKPSWLRAVMSVGSGGSHLRLSRAPSGFVELLGPLPVFLTSFVNTFLGLGSVSKLPMLSTRIGVIGAEPHAPVA